MSFVADLSLANTAPSLSAGFSEEARSLARSLAAYWQRREESMALFGAKLRVLQQLAAVVEESRRGSEEDRGAKPVDARTSLRAEAFIRAIPDSLPLPELAADPDGSVSLEWVPSSVRMFNLAIRADSRVAYAWLDGADRGYGVAVFDGGRIPERVLDAIVRVVGRGASIRTS